MKTISFDIPDVEIASEVFFYAWNHKEEKYKVASGVLIEIEFKINFSQQRVLSFAVRGSGEPFFQGQAWPGEIFATREDAESRVSTLKRPEGFARRE